MSDARKTTVRGFRIFELRVVPVSLTILASFASRGAHLVIYLVGGFTDRHERLLERLGPHKAGKGCLYVKRLADIDLDVLRQLVARSMKVHRGQDRASGAD